MTPAASTAERTYTFATLDKSAWGDGPWQSEPDKVVWVDAATGLDCMILRNRFGAWCGYVGVPAGHRWHGLGYDDVCAEVHGGLTFSGPCEPGRREEEPVICHNPAGRPDDVWWLGFDCAHLFDIAPGLDARERAVGVALPRNERARYRDLTWVRAEVTRLAAQAAAR